MQPLSVKNSKGIVYYLNSKTVTLRGSGKEQTIYYFTRDERPSTALDQVPEGYKIIQSPKTALPLLKRV